MSDDKHSKERSEQEERRDKMKNAQLCDEAVVVSSDSQSAYCNNTAGKINNDGVNNTTDSTEAMKKESENLQQHMFQSAMAAQNAFLTSAGYDASAAMPAAAYYGWLPGIAPVPAFFYSPSFIGFPPNIAAMANANMANIKRPSKEQGKSFSYGTDGRTSSLSNQAREQQQQPAGNNNKVDTEESLNKTVLSGAASDSVDEGLELEDNDPQASGKKRRRQEARRMVSVIKKTVNRQSDCKESADESSDVIDDGTKRGRACTRQIEKTQQYWDRRRKNNVSAKKSRDARRQREMVTNHRSSILETETLRLRADIAALREENERLRQQLRAAGDS